MDNWKKIYAGRRRTKGGHGTREVGETRSLAENFFKKGPSGGRWKRIRRNQTGVKCLDVWGAQESSKIYAMWQSIRDVFEARKLKETLLGGLKNIIPLTDSSA